MDFLGFEYEVRPSASAPQVRGAVHRFLAQRLGGTWHSQLAGDASYAMPGDGREWPVSELWEVSHLLAEMPQVLSAFPVWLAWRDGAIDLDFDGGMSEAAGTLVPEHPQTPQPGATSFEWHLHALDVFAAREFPNSRGENILIGHPDTGYTEHPCLDRGAIDTQRGWDFILAQPIAPQRNFAAWLHGTSTASFIAGRAWDGHEIGVAPQATIVPYRVSEAPVVPTETLAAAIEHATQHCHVISMSVASTPSTSLELAIKNAVQNGVIIVAAAGNRTKRLSVFPARYDAVISMGAVTPGHRISPKSSISKHIDFWAPGDGVWVAGWNSPAGSLKKGIPIYRHTWGTSYATASMAGIAAMWLSHHGRDHLVAELGLDKIATTFRHCVTQSLQNPVGSDRKRLVSAARVLDASITDAPPPPPDRPAPTILEDIFDEAGVDFVLPPAVPNPAEWQTLKRFRREFVHHLGYDEDLAAAAATNPKNVFRLIRESDDASQTLKNWLTAHHA